MRVFVNRSFMGFSESFQNVIETCPVGKAAAGLEALGPLLQPLTATRSTATATPRKRTDLLDIFPSHPVPRSRLDSDGCEARSPEPRTSHVPARTVRQK